MRPRREVLALARQLGRFLTVGLANTALSYAVYVALVHLDVAPPAAGAVAFAAGAVQGYLLNGRWTFTGVDGARQRVRYLTVQLAGAGATSAIVWVATAAGVPRPAAYLVAIPAVTLATFLANRVWVFVSPGHPEGSHRPEIEGSLSPPVNRIRPESRL